MKPGLQPGIEHRFGYRMQADRTVPALYPDSPEFRCMPHVLATGFLVGLLEWGCMRALAPYLDSPQETSLGTHIDISHCAATPPGLIVTVYTRLVAIDGRRLTFEVQAHDEVDLIGRGRHERHVVEREGFEAKVERKRTVAGFGRAHGGGRPQPWRCD